jgi:uncharacterized protein Veg
MIDTNRLAEIKEEMKELLNEAHDILRCGEDYSTLRRAESYWYAHILTSLDSDHGYLGSSMCTMQDTIDECDVEACPGCGCHPGDGVTPDCKHPEGCGFGSSHRDEFFLAGGLKVVG